MRVAMVNWARIEKGAVEGGGANGYAQQLAIEMVAHGHEVHWLCGGSVYERDESGQRLGPLSFREHGPWEGVRIHEVINSPVIAPSLAQFRDPLGEISNPSPEAGMRAWLDRVRPEIVHWHNLEGFSIGCVDACRSAGGRTIFSLHNYHTICPQVYLMHEHRRPCTDFESGRRCERCVDVPRPDETMRVRAGLSVVVDRPARPAAGSGSPPAKNILWPGAPLRPGPWSGQFPDDWTPLANDPSIEREAASGPVQSAYQERRRAMVAMLNRCDAVLAVSRFVREKYMAMGVQSGRISHMPIGTRMVGIAASRTDPLRTNKAKHAPVRLVFLGYHNHYKGLHVLLDALELLTPAVLSRLALSVHAKNIEQIERPILRLKDRLAGVSLGGEYQYEQIPELLRQADFGVVPSVWWDNGPQTVMEFLACGVPVIGADVGGIPDLIEHGRNGLLFRGNDRYDLARKLVLLTSDSGLAARMREGVVPPPSMREHGVAMDRLYANVRDGVLE